MRYLLDTHTLIWFIGGDFQLSSTARSLIDDERNELFFSVANLWEMAIKSSIGKLQLSQPFDELFPAQLESNSIEILPVTVVHLKTVCNLPFYHRDPFDRLMAAQALVERLPVISVDSLLEKYAIERVW